MPKVYSFDVFDTLVTRKVAIPHHIFLMTGIQISNELDLDLEPEIFANARIATEREFIASGDTSGDIYKIYQKLTGQLNIPAHLIPPMVRLEIETEFENIIAIQKHVELLDTLRKRGDQVVYISDMYLGEDILKDLLAGLGIYNDGEKIFVSCDYGANKTSGKLFDIVIKELGINKDNLHHYGNSKKSDIRGAEIAGVSSTYLPEANLNRYERYLAKSSERHRIGTKETLNYSLLAAASRNSRLLRRDENSHIYGVASSVAAPLLYSFVANALENAKDKKIYFLARDGYIMDKIARRIIASNGLQREIKYLYVSREALVLAKFEGMEYEKYIEHVAEIFSEETLRKVFKKLSVSDESIERTGLNESDLDRILFDIEIEELKQIFSEQEIYKEIGKESKKRKNRLLEYLKAEGMLEDEKKVIVDVGWKLTSQNLLADLFNGLKIPPPEGHYIGINEPAFSSLTRGKKHGFLWDVRKDHDGLTDPKMIRIFEVFCSAPQDQTVDYKVTDSGVKPVFNNKEIEHLNAWGIEDMENGILKAVDSILQFNDSYELKPTEWDRVILTELVEFFWCKPTPNEIKEWGAYPYNIKYYDQGVVNLFERIPFHKLLRYVLKKGRLPNSRLDHWPHAYIYSLSPVKREIIKNTLRAKRVLHSVRQKYKIRRIKF